jgi:hypothetical protein
MNLFYGPARVGALPAFQPGGTLRPGRYLTRYTVMRMLSRGLQGHPVPGRPGAG